MQNENPFYNPKRFPIALKGNQSIQCGTGRIKPRRKKEKQKKIASGVGLVAILSLTRACANVLLNTYGTTLFSYLGGNKNNGGSGSSDDEYTVDSCLKEGREIVTELSSEGSVLLGNENNALPLAKGSKVTILGAQSYNYVNGGTGSAGGKYDGHTCTRKEAFDGSKDDGESASREKYLDVNEKAWNWLETAVGGARNVDTTGEYVGHKGDGAEATFKGSDYVNNKDNYGNGDWGGFKRICEFSKSVYENHFASDISEEGYNDTVIVTFARSGAEGASHYSIALGFKSVDWGCCFTKGFDFSQLIANGGNPALVIIKGIFVFLGRSLARNVSQTKAVAVSGRFLEESYGFAEEKKTYLVTAVANVAAPIFGAPVQTVSHSFAAGNCPAVVKAIAPRYTANQAQVEGSSKLLRSPTIQATWNDPNNPGRGGGFLGGPGGRPVAPNAILLQTIRKGVSISPSQPETASRQTTPRA